MPEPVSMIAAVSVFGFAGLLPRLFSSSGVSPEAQKVGSIACATFRHGEESFALNGELITAFETLDNVVEESSECGWDGQAAPPVPLMAQIQARNFLRALPPGFPAPEFAIEPDDGSISMEWHKSYRRVFSVSIGKTNRLAFAGLNGGDKWNGVSSFDGASIPPDLLGLISKTMA